jgi:site-specific DNA-methyltransferase (adenine-specific)
VSGAEERLELVTSFASLRAGMTGLASLADKSVDHVITDPPYSARTHSGQAKDRSDGGKLTELAYDALTPDLVAAIGAQLARVARGWCLVMTDHELFPHWVRALGRYSFQPLPIVMEGMTVRLQGDGPSSWSVWMVVNRATGMIDGTKPGAYVGTPGGDRAGNAVKGAKPAWLMERLIRDYTKPAELICDPFAGSGSTGIAAIKHGRRFVGWEKKESHHAIAVKRLTAAREQLELVA